MNIHELRIVAESEYSISHAFRLREKGRKLLQVQIDLILSLLGVSLIQSATLVVLGVPLSRLWMAMIPWILPFCWAEYRYVLRYIPKSAKLCDECHKPKCKKHLSQRSSTTRIICLRCEHIDVIREQNEAGFKRLGESLAGLRRDLRETRDYPQVKRGPSPDELNPPKTVRSWISER